MGKSRNSSPSSSLLSNITYDSVTEEFSRLSDVQEEFHWMGGQLDGEPDDYYNVRSQLSQTINEAINDVKRTMLKLREDVNEDNLNKYKEREKIALDYINAYFGFMKQSPTVYGDGPAEVPTYKSIAFYIEEGMMEPKF